MFRVLTLSLAAEFVSALLIHEQGKFQSMQDDMFIPNPVPKHLAELRATPINTAGMTTATATSPRGQSVIIKTFPSTEDQHVSGSLNTGRGWEAVNVKKVYDAWLAAGAKGNFLDVGANIGSWSLPIAAAFHDVNHGVSKVITVEGMPPIADHLHSGILANNADNIISFQYAVGAPVPLNSVTMALSPSNKGGSAVVGNKAWTHGAVPKFTTGLTTIDSMLKVEPAMSNVFCAKFDIEGNEGRAIEGAQEFFSKHAPCVVFIELRADFLANAGTSVAKVQAQLAHFGYNFHSSLGAETYEYRQRDFLSCSHRMH